MSYNSEHNDPLKKSLTKLTFIDFCATNNSHSFRSLFTKNEIKYRHLVEYVNEWLLNNENCEAMKLETYLYNPLTDFNQQSGIAYQEGNDKLHFGIRLWISPRWNKQKPIQKIKVLDLIPKIKIAGYKHDHFLNNRNESAEKLSSLNASEFETFDELIERLNKILIENEYIGEILNIETISLPIKNNNWTVDNECLTFGDEIKGVLNILRVHINERLFPYETIEVLNFVPRMETWDSPLAVPNVETYTNILRRASAVLQQRTEPFRIVTFSTIHCPTQLNGQMDNSSESFINPNQTYFTYDQWFHSNIFLGKFIRIILAKLIKPITKDNIPTKSIACKIFVPRMKKQKLKDSYKLSALKQTIHQWIQSTNAEIISAETETLIDSTTVGSLAPLIDTCLHIKRFPCEVMLIIKIYVDETNHKDVVQC